MSNIETFPEWKPQKSLIKLFKTGRYDYIGIDIKKLQYKRARVASLNFTNRKDVRSYFINKNSGGCTVCKSSSNLEIDHKVSVLEWVEKSLPILGLNSEDNLWLLCRFCHSHKSLFL